MSAPAPPIRLLALSGSLRAASRSSALLRAARLLAPPGVEVAPTDAVGRLPHFDLDTELHALPDVVAAFRAELARADAVLVCSPEYAHGIPGAFKNALDWLVGVGLERRPVGVVNPSAGSLHAHPALLEVLRTMDGELVPDAVVEIPTGRRSPDDAALADDPEVAEPLRRCLDALVRAARMHRASAPPA